MHVVFFIQKLFAASVLLLLLGLEWLGVKKYLRTGNSIAPLVAVHKPFRFVMHPLLLVSPKRFRVTLHNPLTSSPHQLQSNEMHLSDKGMRNHGLALSAAAQILWTRISCQHTWHHLPHKKTHGFKNSFLLKSSSPISSRSGITHILKRNI